MPKPESEHSTSEILLMKGWRQDQKRTILNVRIVINEKQDGRECSVWLESAYADTLIERPGRFVIGLPNVLKANAFSFTVVSGLSNNQIAVITRSLLSGLKYTEIGSN